MSFIALVLSGGGSKGRLLHRLSCFPPQPHGLRLYVCGGRYRPPPPGPGIGQEAADEISIIRTAVARLEFFLKAVPFRQPCSIWVVSRVQSWMRLSSISKP
jgi:hypothetical protein